MRIIDEIMPKIRAEARLDKDNKTLWVKADTLDGYDRIIIEDGSVWCRIFYEDCGECAHNKAEQTEPTISKMEQVDKDINVSSKDEPISHDDYVETENDHLEARCLNCNNAKACKEKHWEGCVYEPKDEKTCESCRHWKYIAREWQCETTKCQGYTPKTEPNCSEKPNNCKAKNYCDDCLYTDTCDSKEFFYACTLKATISKMEQVGKERSE